MSEKIQKVLANAGLGSRRQIEGWISEGRITVNGKIAKLGDRITTEDKVRVDGREIKFIKSAIQKNPRACFITNPKVKFVRARS